MTEPLHTFPTAQRLLMNPQAGRRARAVRTLAGSSDWRRSLADRIGAAVVATVGPQRCPATDGWAWPMIGWPELMRQLGGDLPNISFIGAAVPRQAGRERLSLLCRYAGNPVIVKLGSPGESGGRDGGGAGAGDSESLRIEAAALGLLTTRPLPGIATPEVIHFGTVSEAADAAAIDVLVTTAIGLGRQRPALDAPLRTFEKDLGTRLASLDRPDSTPADHVPIHGDLTPWNLRRTGRGLALFDWESAGWGAPGSDLATYRAACDEVRPFGAPR